MVPGFGLVINFWQEILAEAKGFKIPPIRYENLGTETCTVVCSTVSFVWISYGFFLQFTDPENDGVTTLVYMPLCKNDAHDPKFDPDVESWAKFDVFSYSTENVWSIVFIIKI